MFASLLRGNFLLIRRCLYRFFHFYRRFYVPAFLHFLIFLESIVCLDPETKDLSSFTTDKPIGGSWTDKVLAMKDSEKLESQPEAASKESGDCVDDDEWVSILMFL